MELYVIKLLLQPTCQAKWLDMGYVRLFSMVTDGASMVPVGRYAFLESRKGLVTVKNRIMR